MSGRIKEDYYIKKKDKFMRSFEERLTHIRKFIKMKFPSENEDDMVNQMKEEYNMILPEIPYLGGQKNPLTQILVKCMSDLAIFSTLEKRGLSFQEIGEFHYNYVIEIHKTRKQVLEKMGRDPSSYPFETEYVNYQKKLTEDTRKRLYPENWVMGFVESDGKSFEWGWDVHECAIQKAYKKLGAEKYLPLICLGDFYEAEGLGFGFKRTETLGFGGQICTHRFVKNYKTPKAWPPYDLKEFNALFWGK